MVRLIYASTVSDSCTAEGLIGILEAAQKRNSSMGVTGMLLYSPRYFVQWLEGPREPVNFLYSIIAADKRHERTVILEYENTDARDFAKWWMAYVPVDKVGRDIVSAYCPSNEFNPYELTGTGARLMLKAVAAAR